LITHYTGHTNYRKLKHYQLLGNTPQGTTYWRILPNLKSLGWHKVNN
jgi:hypothetical protein